MSSAESVGTRHMDTDDKSRVIEQGYKYVHALAKGLKLQSPQAQFRGITILNDTDTIGGQTRIGAASIEYGLSYTQQEGTGKMNVRLAYKNGRYAVLDDRDIIPTIASSEVSADQYKEVPMEIKPIDEKPQVDSGDINLHVTRGNLIESLGAYFMEHPEKWEEVVSNLDEMMQNEAIKAVLDQEPKEQLEAWVSQYGIDTNAAPNPLQEDARQIAAGMRQAQLYVPGRPMVPINLAAEQIAQKVYQQKREPQNILKDFVKTNESWLTKSDIKELVEKINQLGFYVTVPSGGLKDHVFSMPADMIGENKYLGDDMNDDYFRNRYHAGSPEAKGQEIDTAGRKRPAPRGIFAGEIGEFDEEAAEAQDGARDFQARFGSAEEYLNGLMELANNTRFAINADTDFKASGVLGILNSQLQESLDYYALYPGTPLYRCNAQDRNLRTLFGKAKVAVHQAINDIAMRRRNGERNSWMSEGEDFTVAGLMHNAEACRDCGVEMSVKDTVPSNGINYVTYICPDCGQEETVSESAQAKRQTDDDTQMGWSAELSCNHDQFGGPTQQSGWATGASDKTRKAQSYRDMISRATRRR